LGFTTSSPPAPADSLDRLLDLVEEVGLQIGDLRPPLLDAFVAIAVGFEEVKWIYISTAAGRSCGNQHSG